VSTFDIPDRVERTRNTEIGDALRRNPASLFGAAVVAALTAVAILGPLVVGDPNAGELSRRLQPPSAAHPLGTDPLGRTC